MGFCLILIVAVISHSGLAQLQLVPSDLLLNDEQPTLAVRVSCGVPKGIDTATQVNIRIARYLSSQPTDGKLLASVHLGLTEDQTHNTATISGMLQVMLPQASCHDAGLYHCVIVAYNNNNNTAPVTTQFYQNLTVEAGYLSPDGSSTVNCDFVRNSDSSWYDFTQPIKTFKNGSLQLQIVPDNVLWTEGLSPVSAEVSCELTGGVPASLQSSLAITRLPSPSSLEWNLSSAHIVRADDLPDDVRITGRIVVTLLQADCSHVGSYRCATEGIETYSNLTATNYLSNTWIEYQNEMDITEVWPPYNVSGTWYTRQVSRLTRVLTVEDSQRSYRSMVRRNVYTAEATITVGIVRLPDPTSSRMDTTISAIANISDGATNYIPLCENATSVKTTSEGNAAHHATSGWMVLYFIIIVLLAI